MENLCAGRLHKAHKPEITGSSHEFGAGGCTDLHSLPPGLLRQESLLLSPTLEFFFLTFLLPIHGDISSVNPW